MSKGYVAGEPVAFFGQSAKRKAQLLEKAPAGVLSIGIADPDGLLYFPSNAALSERRKETHYFSDSPVLGDESSFFFAVRPASVTFKGH